MTLIYTGRNTGPRHEVTQPARGSADLTSDFIISKPAVSATSGWREKTRPRGNDLTFLLLLLKASEELKERSRFGLCLQKVPAAHTRTAVWSSEGRADSQGIVGLQDQINEGLSEGRGSVAGV